MADRQKLEQVLDLLINEEQDQDKATELLHQYMVEKAREVYESLLEDEDDIEDDMDEIEDDEVGDLDDTEEVVGLDDEMPDMDDEIEGDTEERIEDLEAALADLRAEFDRLMSDEDSMDMDDMDMDDMDMDIDMDMDESIYEESSDINDFINNNMSNFQSEYDDDLDAAVEKFIAQVEKAGHSVTDVDNEADPVIVAMSGDKPVAWYDLENSNGFIESFSDDFEELEEATKLQDQVADPGMGTEGKFAGTGAKSKNGAVNKESPYTRVSPRTTEGEPTDFVGKDESGEKAGKAKNHTPSSNVRVKHGSVGHGHDAQRGEGKYSGTGKGSKNGSVNTKSALGSGKSPRGK